MTALLAVAADGVAEEYGAFVPGEAVRVGPTGSGPLDGMTFAVKDLIDVAGYATGGGNPDWRASHAPATATAPAPAAMLDAGATLVGKTITDELAFSLEGANAHYGTPVNPMAPDRLPGGSSSGSAVAVAARLCDVALGTDTGGSVRIPASFCGVYGIRPTHGRVSTRGVISFGRSFDTVGWFARDAATLKRVGKVLLAQQPPTPIDRLLFAADIAALADDEVSAAFGSAVSAWPIDGGVDVLRGEDAEILEAFRVIQGAEIWRSLGGWITEVRPRFGASIAARFASTRSITDADVARWQPFRGAFRDRMATLLPPGTAIIFPTSPIVAPLKSVTDSKLDVFYAKALMVNAVAGLAGLPQISLPLASAAGAPVGISILAGRRQDEALLDLACALSGGQMKRAGGMA